MSLCSYLWVFVKVCMNTIQLILYCCIVEIHLCIMLLIDEVMNVIMTTPQLCSQYLSIYLSLTYAFLTLKLKLMNAISSSERKYFCYLINIRSDLVARIFPITLKYIFRNEQRHHIKTASLT
jgi:hypothetical protein